MTLAFVVSLRPVAPTIGSFHVRPPLVLPLRQGLDFVSGKVTRRIVTMGRNDQATDAVPVYQNVIMLDDTVPASKLYSTASLKPGADVARNVIAHLGDPFSLNVNPSFIGAIFAIRQQLIKIKGGLDFWGRKANTVPIWTFDYLQNVAINFTQLAINAEQEVINFWDRADQAGLTRVQIAASLNQGPRTAALQ